MVSSSLAVVVAVAVPWYWASRSAAWRPACLTRARRATRQVNGPSVYRTYLAAAQRLGLSDDASGYWELHIKEDERHGRQMVEDVAVKLVDMCAASPCLLAHALSSEYGVFHWLMLGADWLHALGALHHLRVALAHAE